MATKLYTIESKKVGGAIAYESDVYDDTSIIVDTIETTTIVARTDLIAKLVLICNKAVALGFTKIEVTKV